jgi:hypothetical protein
MLRPHPGQPPLQLPEARNCIGKHYPGVASHVTAASRPTPVSAARSKEFHGKASRPHPSQFPFRLPEARNSIGKHDPGAASHVTAASRPTPVSAARSKEFHGKAWPSSRVPRHGRIQANPRFGCQKQRIPQESIAQEPRPMLRPHPGQPPFRLPEVRNSMGKHYPGAASRVTAASRPTPLSAARSKEFHGKAWPRSRAPRHGRIQANPRFGCQKQGIPQESTAQEPRPMLRPHPGQPPFRLPEVRNSMGKHYPGAASRVTAASRPTPLSAASSKEFHRKALPRSRVPRHGSHPGQPPFRLSEVRNSMGKHGPGAASRVTAASRPTPASAARSKEFHGKAWPRSRAPRHGRIQANPRFGCQKQGIP